VQTTAVSDFGGLVELAFRLRKGVGLSGEFERPVGGRVALWLKRDADSGVEWQAGFGRLIDRQPVDEDGKFQLRGLGAGRYIVSWEGQGSGVPLFTADLPSRASHYWRGALPAATLEVHGAPMKSGTGLAVTRVETKGLPEPSAHTATTAGVQFGNRIKNGFQWVDQPLGKYLIGWPADLQARRAGLLEESDVCDGRMIFQSVNLERPGCTVVYWGGIGPRRICKFRFESSLPIPAAQLRVAVVPFTGAPVQFGRLPWRRLDRGGEATLSWREDWEATVVLGYAAPRDDAYGRLMGLVTPVYLERLRTISDGTIIRVGPEQIGAITVSGLRHGHAILSLRVDHPLGRGVITGRVAGRETVDLLVAPGAYTMDVRATNGRMLVSRELVVLSGEQARLDISR
jgi:hypothetical protein